MLRGRASLLFFVVAAWVFGACGDAAVGGGADGFDLGPPEIWSPGDVDPTGGGGSGYGYGYGGGGPDAVVDDAGVEVEVVEPPAPCDEVTFHYADASAGSVWVTGSWVDWAATPAAGALELVEGEDGVWSLTVAGFEHGQVHYQFIVDGGAWVADPDNGDRITDYLGGFRSVLDVCTATPAPACGVVNFAYVNTAATRVRLAGEFTGWENGAVEMVQVGGVWRAGVQLEVGTYQYKLIVGDSNWIVDPNNPYQVDDGFGGFNSLLDVGCEGSSGICGDVEAFDWRDTVLYFAMVDRFYDSDGESSPVPGVSGDNGSGASGQYEGGDLAGVTARMAYLRDLGVSAIWLSAPYDNRDVAGASADPGQDSHMYSGYHGYWPSPANVDYGGAVAVPRPKVESRIGTEQDLRDLIAAAHGSTSVNGHGIKVLFDYVMNHVDADSGLYKAHKGDGWFATANGQTVLCGGNAVCGGPCWEHPEWGQKCAFTDYLPPFDFGNAAARRWSIDDALWWAKEYGIDGYRLDAIKHVPIAWLEELRDALDKAFVEPDGGRFYLVGETFTWGDYGALAYYVDPKERLDGQFDFPFRKEVCEAVMGGGNLQNLAGWMAANDNRYGPGALMSTWLGNHDIPRAIHTATGQVGCTQGSYAAIGWSTDFPQPQSAEPYDKLGLAFAVMMTNPGLPLIYYGDEIGLAGGGDPDNRRMMPWDDGALNAHQKALRAKVKTLAKIRGENRALTRGRRTTLSVSPDHWVYRMGGCGAQAADVIVALNKSGFTRSVEILQGNYTDLIDGATVTGGSVSVPAWGYLIYRVE